MAACADPNHEQPRVSAKPRASSLASCARQQVYAMRGVQPTNPMPPDAVLTAEQGRHMELLIEQGLARLGYVVDGQQGELPDDYPVTGHPDGILYKGDESGLHPLALLEQKHLGQWSYLRILQHGLYSASPGYYIQALMYADSLGLDNVVFVITAQDASAVRTQLTQMKRYATEGKTEATRAKNAWAMDVPASAAKMQIIEYSVDDNRALIMEAHQRAKVLADVAGNSLHVQREFDPLSDNFPCNYCDWKDACMKEPSDGAVVPKMRFM